MPKMKRTVNATAPFAVTDDNVDPVIKVTRIGLKGWGIRCYSPRGEIFMQDFAERKTQIGPMCRHLLRWWDKCGGMSIYASRARHRAWDKAAIADNEIDRNLRNQDMNRMDKC